MKPIIRNYLFHRVFPERDRLWDPMDPVLFDKCIRKICTTYKVFQFEDLIENPELVKTERNIATIMFDDGYKDNIEYAAPILDKYKCKASFYVVTDSISYNKVTWTYFLEQSFQRTNRKKINLDFDFLPESLRIQKLNSIEERVRYFWQMLPVLKKVTHSQRNEFLKRIEFYFDDVEMPQVMMNWNEVKQLNLWGHRIGSHTVSHPMLGTIEDLEFMKKEIFESGRIIESQLGKFPIAISYPLGSFNDFTKKYSEEAGYKTGLAVKQNNYFFANDTRFEVSRIELYNESWLKTRMRINNTLERVKMLIGYR